MEERIPYSRFSVTMMGALLVFLGAAILANPGDVTVFMVRLVGFACAIFAIMMFVGHLLRAQAIDAIPFEEIAGAGILLLFGAVMGLFPDGFAKVLFSVLGVLIILSGLGDIARSHKMLADDEQKERVTLRIGIVTVAVGVFVALLPSAALRIFPVLCGAALVLDGLSELYIALRMGETEEPKA